MRQIDTDEALERYLQLLVAATDPRRLSRMLWREIPKCEHCGAQFSSEGETLTHLCLNLIDGNLTDTTPI